MAPMFLQVAGMTCDHCTRAIVSAIDPIEGVERVSADFTSGRVDVTTDDRFDEPAVRAAIEEEGYELLSVTRGEP